MGACHSPSGFADVAYLHLDYGDALTAIQLFSSSGL